MNNFIISQINLTEEARRKIIDYVRTISNSLSRIKVVNGKRKGMVKILTTYDKEVTEFYLSEI